MSYARLLAEIEALNKTKERELFAKPRARSAGNLVVAPYTPKTPRIVSAKERLEQARILIVDDEPTVLRLLKERLTAEGYKHILAIEDSYCVIDTVKNYRPDLILLDLIMPTSGIDILRQLRSEQISLEYLPVIAISATESEHLRRLALATGASDFITKPFNPL
jgi:CheY-like chemotaxis protein